MDTVGLLSRSIDGMQTLVKTTISSVGAEVDDKLVRTSLRVIEGCDRSS